MSHCQDLALDQLAFTIVKHLADTNEPHLDMNNNVAKWLSNLTDLATQFFKRFSQVDMLGLFTYLTNRLRDDDGDQSFVLAYMVN